MLARALVIKYDNSVQIQSNRAKAHFKAPETGFEMNFYILENSFAFEKYGSTPILGSVVLL